VRVLDEEYKHIVGILIDQGFVMSNRLLSKGLAGMAPLASEELSALFLIKSTSIYQIVGCFSPVMRQLLILARTLGLR
jgi:hypothetical protein